MNIKAILAGWGVVFLINALAGLLHFSLLWIVYDILGSKSGFFSITFLSYFFSIAKFISYILGGFVAAKIAKKDEVLYGFLSGTSFFLLSALVTFIIVRLSKSLSTIFDITIVWSFIIYIMGSILGAWIRKKIHDKKNINPNMPLEEKIENLGNNNYR